MGKKILIICDLCKNETDDDFTKLSFKKPGKSKGLNFEVCSACATKFQVQLVGENLLTNWWNFNEPREKAIGEPQKCVLGNELDDNDHFVEEKEAERKRLLEDIKPKATATNKNSEQCSHMNKSSIDPETFKQFCKDCGEPVSPPARKHR